MTITSRINMAYSIIIDKTTDGTYVAKTNKGILISSHATDAAIPIQAAIDSLGSNSAKTIFIRSGNLYSLGSSINFASMNGYCRLLGEHRIGSQLRPTGDFPAIDVNGAKIAVTIENLYFDHNQAGYTSNMIYFRNGVNTSDITNCSFYDQDRHVGNSVGLDTTTGSIYRNNFIGLYSQGFNNSIFASVPNTSFFCNGNNFRDCWFWVPDNAGLALNTAASTGFDSNVFTSCQVQCKSAAPNQTNCGFDYETNHLGHAWYTTHHGCIVWDLGAGLNYAIKNVTSHLELHGCIPDQKIGGAGAASNVRRYSMTSNTSGTATVLSGTTSIVVTHGAGFTPSLNQIRVTPTNNLGTATKWWISTPTATQFTINVDVNPGATTATFVWYMSP
jgi:hypothetical protein